MSTTPEQSTLIRRSTSKRQKANVACCSTMEDSYCWFMPDTTGIVFASIVWTTIIFAGVVLAYITYYGSIWYVHSIIIGALMLLGLWAHLKIIFTDPGAVPANAHPIAAQTTGGITMCGRCDGYKPPRSHHDRISNRCISRMDHFCPWTNNAIGAKNQKHFFLFLIYVDLASTYFYIILVIHMVYCNLLDCALLEGTSLILARIVIFVLLFAMLFTSSMIINQTYGLITGLGTIDRMKAKNEALPYETPVPFSHVFGDNWWFYLLPINPWFRDPEEVLHYTLSQEPYASSTPYSNRA